jgi:hypothetical protein
VKLVSRPAADSYSSSSLIPKPAGISFPTPSAQCVYGLARDFQSCHIGTTNRDFGGGRGIKLCNEKVWDFDTYYSYRERVD